MYFSRITFNTATMDPNEFVALSKGDLYAIHTVLWRLFPDDPDAKRDFLFRKAINNSWPFFYMVSQRQPQAPNKTIKIETKVYQPRLDLGHHLSFNLRVNPVITKKNSTGKRIRHDVVMNNKCNCAYPFSIEDRISSGQLEHTAGITWLSARAEQMGCEFDTEALRVYGYQQHRFKSRKQKELIKFSSLDFSGRLIVTEPDKFRHALFNGIGPAKAFGCGLMLVRRT